MGAWNTFYAESAYNIMEKGVICMAKALPQKVAEAVLKKSFSHIALKPWETPQDNPFLAERSRLQLLKTKPEAEDSVNSAPRKP